MEEMDLIFKKKRFKIMDDRLMEEKMETNERHFVMNNMKVNAKNEEFNRHTDAINEALLADFIDGVPGHSLIPLTDEKAQDYEVANAVASITPRPVEPLHVPNWKLHMSDSDSKINNNQKFDGNISSEEDSCDLKIVEDQICHIGQKYTDKEKEDRLYPEVYDCRDKIPFGDCNAEYNLQSRMENINNRETNPADHYPDCSQCSYEASSDTSLTEGIHSKVKIFKCSQCKYHTCSSKNLKDHKLEHLKMGREQIECSNGGDPLNKMCAINNDTSQQLKSSCEMPVKSEYSDRKDFEYCSVLDHEGNDYHSVDPNEDSEYQTVHPNKSEFCSVEHDDSEYGLGDSKDGNLDIRRFKCELCEFSTNHKNYLKIHGLKHLETKKFKCSECDYSTNFKSCFDSHGLNHSEMEDLKCAQCEYVTKSKNNLERHEMNHLDTKLYNCSKCEYSTNSKSSLKSHESIHTEVKRYKCSQCEYATKWKCNLKSHETSNHTETKIFKCVKCEYSTKWKSNLKIHGLTHSETKMFQCSQCEYATKWKSNLRSHKSNHSNSKFRCSKCAYTTKWKSNLKSHESNHSKMQLECSKCEYTTKWKCNLKRHESTHSETELKCSHCEFTTMLKNVLKTHEESHDGDGEEAIQNQSPDI